MGNAIGSNITNIGLIIGLTALLTPITVKSRLIRREFPFCCSQPALAVYLLADGALSIEDSIGLLLLFTAVMGWTIASALRQRHDMLARDLDTEAMSEPALSLKTSIAWLFLGILLLVLSSRLLVWGAVTLAQMLGISDLIIGLTVIAIGTSTRTGLVTFGHPQTGTRPALKCDWLQPVQYPGCHCLAGSFILCR